MGVLTEVVTSPLTYLSIVFVLGFLPGFTLRVCLLLYPKGHPRRTELVGELYSLPRPHRLFFVAEQVETALFEAPRERREAKRRATALGVEDRTADVLLDEVAELLDEKSRRDGARLGRTLGRVLRRPGRITVEMALAPEDGYDVIPSLWVDDYSAMTPVDEEGTPLTSDASDGDEDRGLA